MVENYFGVPPETAWPAVPPVACPMLPEGDMAAPLLRPKLGEAAVPKPSEFQAAIGG